ncbi:putative toxin-antitoxin system toxin component, PIN family [Mucilaginibacter mali]|uniref:Putative toxin-antitoxin system toxin component, PIN family n=1 Tax=Mucilaginibacter mali TaxID=2740462 RepID=A0A7D4TVM1_9SPHI|nr:putative toxin-antitoxin system toxin component, PIN family [Mucilaginibacter mali]QKJ28677.1 putative toxin-antitoxin system toxin component, PIN family [Mucilaginibacter mali]
MKVVIDTNCLLVSIPSQSKYYWLYIAFKTGRFEWLISNEIMAEYEEMLIRRYSEKTANLVLSILSVAPNVTFEEPYFKWNLVELDADDNKFADLSIAANADFLVTNDKHFAPLKLIDFPRINIVSLDEFEKVILG